MNYINISVAVLLFGIGFFIKVKKVTWLISGYNTSSPEEKETYDVNKLCEYVGNFIYFLASIWAVMTFFTIVFPSYIFAIIVIGISVFTVAIVGGVIYLNTSDRVKK